MRGGAREGAGRKKLPEKRNRVVLYATENEEAAIRDFLLRMRNEATAQKSIELEESGIIELTTQESNEQETTAQESEEQEPMTVADGNYILELYDNNAGMYKGKYDYIAGTLNEKRMYDGDGNAWTPESIKKKINKLKRENA